MLSLTKTMYMLEEEQCDIYTCVSKILSEGAKGDG